MPSQIDVDKIRNTSAVDTLTIDASGNTTLGGNLVLPSTKTIKNENNNNVVSVTSAGNVTVGGAGTVTVGGSGNVSLGTGNVTLGGGSGAVTLGGSGNLVLSGSGIDFGTGTDGSGTVTGGVLDDYEEGTWTPTMTGATSGGGTITANENLCTYTKIGRLVNISIGLNAFTFPDATTFIGELRLGGIPFTPINGNYESNVGDVYFYPSGQWDAFSNFTGLSTTINSLNGAFITFKPKVTDSDRQISLNNGNTNFSSSSDKYLRFSMTYITD